MGIKAFGATDVGLRRKSNQDSILIDKDIGLFVVADGMGGHSGGEVASAIAVERAQALTAEFINTPNLDCSELIKKIFIAANEAIYKKAEEQPSLKGMGTTMVLGISKDSSMYIGNVGDSRAYLFSKESLWKITEDHSLINEQLRAGMINESDIENLSGKNVITRSVGFEKTLKADVFVREIRPNENFLFCSDGLCGLVEDDVIQNICNTYSGYDVVEKSIESAKDAGGDDNISVIYVESL